MQLLKPLRLSRLRDRYRVYLRCNAVFLIAYFVCFLLGFVLCTAYVLSARGIDSCEVFRLHWHSRIAVGVTGFAVYGFCRLVPFLLAALVFGITIYAPVTGFLCTALSALSTGAYLRFLLGELYGACGLWPFFYALLGSVPIALLLCAAFAFSTSAGLRIFTPKSGDRREEEQLFGGTLFCAPYFCNTINLRFLTSYLMLFFTFGLALFGLCVLQAALVLKL